MIKEHLTKYKSKYFFITLLLAMLLRFFILGFKYFPYLDDYIQYDVYKMYDAKYVFTFIGTIFVRPFAALADYYIWSNIGMVLSVFLLLVMHFLSAFLLSKSFKTVGITLGRVFYIIFAFSPIIFEGIYWISASSRIVTPLFFAALSVFFLTKGKIVLFALFNFLSYGFYEQTLIFSFILAIYFSFKTKKEYILIPVTNAVLFALYYLIFSKSGQFASRNAIDFSISNIKRFYHIIENTELSTILNFENLYFILIAIILSVLLYFFGEKSSFSKEKLIIGILTVVLPFMPYLFLNSAPSLRNTVICAIGFGMIFDSIKHTKMHVVTTVLTCTLFINAQLVMLKNQRDVYQTDALICKNLAPHIKENKTYYLIGAHEKYNTSYSLNITSSDWALTGAMRSYLHNKNIKLIIPTKYVVTDKKHEKIYIDNFLKISK